MKIHEVMTGDPTCCTRTETAQNAAIVMLQLNVGIVPIIDDIDTRKLIGVITDRDLCIEVVALGWDPSAIKLEDCMTTGVVTCRPEDDVELVLQLMRQHQVRRIPVVDEFHHVVGIIATSDLLLAADLTPQEVDETLQDISEPSLEEFESFIGIAAMDAAALLNQKSPPV